jgi:hypothetical protein
VVAPIVLRNAAVVVMVMVVVMAGYRGPGVEGTADPERDSAGSERYRTDGGDAISCAREHDPPFLVLTR